MFIMINTYLAIDGNGPGNLEVSQKTFENIKMYISWMWKYSLKRTIPLVLSSQ